MKLGELIQGLGMSSVCGDVGTEVIDVDCDSRAIKPGWGFIAIKGGSADGYDYIPQAIANGASAIFSERQIPSSIDCASVLLPSKPREAMAFLAKRVHASPDEKMPLVAVTGTNGKTTTTTLMRQLLMASGMGCGLIGTVLNAAGGVEENAVLTSPESPSFYRWAKKSLDAGDAALALEASSVALASERLFGAKFKVGLFTNLTQDHLDFHSGMEEYFEAKAKLFSQCERGLVNIEDEYGRRLLADNTALISYGLNSGEYRAENLKLRHDGTSFVLASPLGRHTINSPLLGRFNAYNTLAALAALLEAGFDLDTLLPHLWALRGAPGRLERIDSGQPFGVMVDYAHTPDALEKLLSAGRDLLAPGGRLHVLFGCGGDRDRTKRPIMAAAVVAGGADVIWHTSDNTRGEDPERILDDAAVGIPAEIIKDPKCYHRISDRVLAVKAAIAACHPGDLLLLAGKGHEPYQDVMGVKHPYSDRLAVEAALNGEEIPRPWASRERCEGRP
jgi:UDP-N-acetylmuramoyl-L-alanyl-D-glutamate--2,6-diaminopimelate ligase